MPLTRSAVHPRTSILSSSAVRSTGGVNGSAQEDFEVRRKVARNAEQNIAQGAGRFEEEEDVDKGELEKLP